MLKTAKYLLALMLSLAVLPAAAQEWGPKVKAGDMVPQFTVEMFDGSKVNIDELQGKVVLLTFFGTQCVPCLQEMKRAQQDIINRFAGEDFVFLPITWPRDRRQDIEKYRQTHGLFFPMGMDTGKEIFYRFGYYSIPRNFIIDKQGRVVSSDGGYSPDGFEWMLRRIAKELKPKKIKKNKR